jgi:hypothetical protein
LLTITVSGPQAARKQALKALKDAGFHIVLNDVGDPSGYDWGHSPGHETQVVDGVVTALDPSVPTCFLTVEGESVDRVVEVAESTGWRLRSHRDAPEAVRAPTVEERLAAVGLSLGDLRTALGV